MIKRGIAFLKSKLIREKIIPVNIPIVEGKLLEGKIALIIGGSGGIGLGIASSFLANGCQVIISGTNEKKLSTICQKLGENAGWVMLDIRNINDISTKINDAVKIFGRIDILVNSAGVHCAEMFGNVTEDTWNKVMNINLKGMYFASQEMSQYMIRNKIKGHILNISSASCVKPGWTPYEISKWGVRGMTLGFADKLVKYGIVVNSIAPGPVATSMLGREVGDNLTWNGNPTGRMATTSEIGNLAVFMVSNLGDLIVGDTYFISGGSGTICIDK